MVKLALGFAVFAAVVIYVLSQSGGNIDMSGEKHGVDASHTAPAAASSSQP